MKDFDYISYPEGYENLQKKVIPFFMRPMAKMLMSWFMQILIDG